MTEKKKKNPYDRFIGWFDSRFGFEKTWLHNIPDFNLNPLYWLGIIMIVTFLMQGVTGIYMTMFYVPEPTQAHSSTTTIISSVPLGHFVETLHLYTAYAMIIVAFLHLVRNYFGSAHKKPRELMWVAGIIMLIIVLGFGLTGYLLPWTVISKSATDVAIGFTGYLPAPLATLGNSLLTGTGTDAAELTRFFSIHTIWLPAALIGFIALKIYMFEVHGPSYIPFYGKAKKAQMYPWFPKIFLYAVKLIALFVAILFALTALFPLQLPPVYNPATASAYVIRPDWYFLAVYQVFKLGFFDGANVPYAIFTIGLFFAILILLPFYDHSKRRGLSSRPVFVTAGLIALVEFIFLTVWGYLTPGQTVPAPIAIAGLLGVAGAVALGSGIIYAVYRRKGRAVSSKKLPASGTLNSKTMTSTTSATMFGLGRYSKFTALFLVLLGVASVALASITQTPIDIATNYTVLLLPGGTFAFSMLCLIWMVKKAVLTFEAESAKNKKGDFQNV